MNWKKMGKRLLFPPLWMIILLVVISVVMLSMVFVKGWQEKPVAYVVYVVSFYAVVVVTAFLGLVLPKQYRQIKGKIYDNPLGNRYMTDMAFRTHVSLYLSLTINLLYVGVNALFGVLYGTVWFGILAGYYAILAVMRFLLLRFVNRNGIGKECILEFRRSRLCGFILMTVNLTLSGAVLMILYQNKGYEYPGILIYVMALYTFYVTIAAIINIIKYRKYKSPVMSTAKIINLSAALVSMLALETAMFSQFGKDMSTENQQLMIMLTGAGVSIVVVTMSIYMIVRATKEIKKLKLENEGAI